MAILRTGSAFALMAGAAVFAAVACGGGDEGKGDSDGDGTGGNGYNLDGTGSFYGQGGGSAACEPPADDSGCTGAQFEGENTPLDIYVMFDVSCSMSCSVDETGCCDANNSPAGSRILPVRAAMEAFLRDDASRGISVGLGFFGDHDVNNENNSPTVCTVDAHTDAAVEIAALPGAADTLIDTLQAEEPQGGTPTHLAIAGACEHVAAWKESHAGRKTVVLLVTDGIPEHSCDADIQQAVAAAEECYAGGSGFEIYVLGVQSNNNNAGSSLDNLNGIATAGGTDRAYLTDADDVEGSMLAALNSIRADAAIPCDLQIPPPQPGETLNPGLVNIGICDSSREVVVTPRVEDAAACGDHDGWYYDDPNSPEMIHLCNVTCDTVSAPGSTLFFSIGCETVVEIQ